MAAAVKSGRLTAASKFRCFARREGTIGSLLPEARVILVSNAAALWLDPPPESPAGVAPPPAPDRYTRSS
jgi:hypothetical protein